MSAQQSVDVLDRVAQKRREGAEPFAEYAFLVFGILGFQAPEVLAFVMDRADEWFGRGTRAQLASLDCPKCGKVMHGGVCE